MASFLDFLQMNKDKVCWLFLVYFEFVKCIAIATLRFQPVKGSLILGQLLQELASGYLLHRSNFEDFFSDYF